MMCHKYLMAFTACLLVAACLLFSAVDCHAEIRIEWPEEYGYPDVVVINLSSNLDRPPNLAQNETLLRFIILCKSTTRLDLKTSGGGHAIFKC